MEKKDTIYIIIGIAIGIIVFFAFKALFLSDSSQTQEMQENDAQLQEEDSFQNRSLSVENETARFAQLVNSEPDPEPLSIINPEPENAADFATQYYNRDLGDLQVVESLYNDFFKIGSQEIRETLLEDYKTNAERRLDNIKEWEAYLDENEDELNSLGYGLERDRKIISEAESAMNNMIANMEENIVPPPELKEEYERKVKLMEQTQPPDYNQP